MSKGSFARDDLRIQVALASVARQKRGCSASRADSMETQRSYDFIEKDTNIIHLIVYCITATILFFPIGVQLIKNTFQAYNYGKKGQKTLAVLHKQFVKSLLVVAVVAGTLFWSILAIMLTVHMVILRK